MGKTLSDAVKTDEHLFPMPHQQENFKFNQYTNTVLSLRHNFVKIKWCSLRTMRRTLFYFFLIFIHVHYNVYAPYTPFNFSVLDIVILFVSKL